MVIQIEMSRSEALFERARNVLPGGVSRDTVMRVPRPNYAATGRGSRVVDAEGREYVDFANNMASLIHGHAYPPVVDAVYKQLQKGTCFTFATDVEIEFAEHMCSRSIAFEQIRFMNSGTEAVMAAVKAARAFTGRPKIAKVEGAYHGAYDYVEVSQTSGPERWGPSDAPASVALAAGTPRGVVDDVVVIPFNRPGVALAILNACADSIAGVLVDPIPHRVGLIPAEAGFLRALRDWTSSHGALLIFDEVITFRTEVGGAQARYGVKPDLTSLGKAIGGGFPVGAVAGCREVMSVFASGDGGPRLPQSGTFSANPITMTAGLTAMRHYGSDAVRRLNALGDAARAHLAEAIKVSGRPACVTGAGSMFRIHLQEERPTTYRDAYLDKAARKLCAEFVEGVLEEGVMLTNTATGMLSTVMEHAEVDRMAEAVLRSLRSLSGEAA